MIDTTVPETGMQPRDVLLEIVTDTFDEALDLNAAGTRPPQLDPSIHLARAAQRRDDVAELDAQLRNIAVAAIATRVRLRCATAPDTPGA